MKEINRKRTYSASNYDGEKNIKNSPKSGSRSYFGMIINDNNDNKETNKKISNKL